MPIRKKSVAFTFRPSEKHPLSEANWRQIERCYGYSLSSDVRKRVEYANDCYGAWVGVQEFGAPINEIRQRLDDVLRASADLRDKLTALKSPIAPASGKQSAAMLESCLKKILVGMNLPSNEPLDTIGKVISAVEKATIQSRDEANDGFTFRAGLAWENWVWWITETFTEASLPTGVRKDGKTSPFVSFFRELQSCLPANWRCHSHSDLALAKAIIDARALLRDLNSRD